MTATDITAFLVIAFAWALFFAVAFLPLRLIRHHKLPPLPPMPPLPEGSPRRRPF